VIKLPLIVLKWVICVVVLYTSVSMFISSRQQDNGMTTELKNRTTSFQPNQHSPET
jgi:hypothetical protein